MENFEGWPGRSRVSRTGCEKRLMFVICAYSYGHGVLRKPDPRFIALQQFSSSRAELKDSPIIRLVNKTSEVAPDVLTEHGKVRTKA